MSLPAHARSTALSPHHAAESGMPVTSLPSATSVKDTSERLREKSADTTQRDPAAVSSARKRPLGEGRICVNGPRDIRWSMWSRASRVTMVVPVDMRISVWPLEDCSGGMTAQEEGGPDKPYLSDWNDVYNIPLWASDVTLPFFHPRTSTNCNPPVNATNPPSYPFAERRPISVASTPSVC